MLGLDSISEQDWMVELSDLGDTGTVAVSSKDVDQEYLTEPYQLVTQEKTP